MKSRDLLKTLPESQYPAEFLVARLLGKRGALFRNWELLISGGNPVESLAATPFYPFLKKHGAPGAWRFLRHEHLWIYERMNNGLRSRFAPYFLYHETNTLLVCLRCLACREEGEAIDRELYKSLLHEGIQDILTSGLVFAELLTALERYLCSYSPLFTGLAEVYGQKGLAALEVFLRNSFTACLLDRKQPPMLQTFLHYLVDFHNCLALAKTLRWQTGAEPVLLPGGTVPASLCKRAYFRRDMAPVLQFLRLPDSDIAGTVSPVSKLETALLRRINGKLKRWSYQRHETGDILFYLWEQYCYVRNISLLLNTMTLDDEPVRESLVA